MDGGFGPCREVGLSSEGKNVLELISVVSASRRVHYLRFYYFFDQYKYVFITLFSFYINFILPLGGRVSANHIHK